MKKITLPIISLFTIFLLNGCASKAQTDVIDSNSKDISYKEPAFFKFLIPVLTIL